MMPALPPGNAQVFAPAMRLIAQLSLLDREIDGPDDKRWLLFWEIAAMEISAR